jgi:hypothetical protein
MNTLTVILNDSLYNKVLEISKKENIPVEQFASSAIAEKLAVFTEKDYLEKRFKNISREEYLKALSNSPDIPPDEFDKL